MQSQEHFIVDLTDPILRQQQFANLGRSFKGVLFDPGNAIPSHVQLHQVRQSSEQTIRLDANQFVVVEQ